MPTLCERQRSRRKVTPAVRLVWKRYAPRKWSASAGPGIQVNYVHVCNGRGANVYVVVSAAQAFRVRVGRTAAMARAERNLSALLRAALLELEPNATAHVRDRSEAEGT